MLPIKYTYLLGSGLFLIPWFLIFFKRKDLRRLLFLIGALSVFPGLIIEYFWWTRDWWAPYTITNSRVGIEDVILGLISTGVCASLYLVISKKKLVEKLKPNLSKNLFILLIILLSHLLLFSILFNFKINSFISTLITMSSASIILFAKRRDLYIPAIINATLMVVLVTPIYLLQILVTPNFVEKTWMINKLSGAYLLGIPIEDYVFYFLSGLLLFGVYPFYKNSRLEDLK